MANIDQIYRDMLGRAPDAGGRAFFSGQSAGAIQKAIKSSAEYKNRLASGATSSYTTSSASPYTHTYAKPAASTFDPYGYLSGKAGMSAAPAAPAFDMAAFMADYEAKVAAQQAEMQQQMEAMTAGFQQQMQAQQEAIAAQQQQMLDEQQQYAQQMMINQAQSERDPADVRIGSNKRRDLARAGTAGYFGRGGMRLGSLNLGTGTGGPSRVPQASMNPTPKPNPFAFPKPTPKPNPFGSFA
jgi:hypothetical protein